MPFSAYAPVADCAVLRRTMVDCQIRTVDVTDHALIARFLEVPREKLLPDHLAPFAYSDMALKLPPVAGGAIAHLLPPAVLARLVQAAGVQPTDKVLDIASGIGYSTAILAGLAGEVVALETDAGRAETIKSHLASLGVDRVHVTSGPLKEGVPAESPFDVIFVNGAVEAHLDQLLKQLRSGGRLLSIVRKTAAPGYGASHAVRFDCQGGHISSSVLFDADAPVLPDFRKDPEFVF